MVGSWSSGSHATVRWGSGVRVARAVGRATVLLGVAGPLLLAGCGDGADGGDRAASGPTETTDDRRDDEPLATNPEAVRPYIENLFAEYDYVVNQILVDPGLVRDRDSRLARRYVGLYEPESDIPEEVLDTWAAMSEEGEHFEPYEEGQPINTTTLGQVEALTDHEVSFQVCIEQHYRVYDADQRPIEEQPDRARVGEGVAVHVDGEWRLQRVHIGSAPSRCAD